jgi:hypothetical protein
MTLPLRRLGPVLVLPLLAAIGFQGLVANPRALLVDAARPSIDYVRRPPVRDVGNDLTSVFLPRFKMILASRRRDHELPYWDASGFGGRPLIGNPQAGLNYPPVWAAYRFGVPSALGWLTLAHLIWGSFGVYILTRALGLSRLAATVAGGCFEMSPYLLGHTFEGHYPHVWAACWYPWTFWSMLLATRGRALGTWLLPIVLSLALLAGHPQEWYYLALASSFWMLWDVITRVRIAGLAGGMRRSFVWCGLVGVNIAACAIEWLPARAIQPLILKSGVISLELIRRYDLHSLNLLQLLSPFALGGPHDYFGHDNYWETLLSMGLAPLFLAVIGLALHPRRRMVCGWALLVVLAVLLAAGHRLGLFTLAYALLPGMDRFRVPSRTLFLAALGASVLAGLGVDVLRGRELPAKAWRRARVRLGFIAVALGAVIMAAGLVPRLVPAKARAIDTGIPSQVAQGWKTSHGETGGYRGVRAAGLVAGNRVFWGSLIAVAAVVTGAALGRQGRSRTGCALGAVALVELALLAHSLLVCAPAGGFDRFARIREILTKGLTDAQGPFRVAVMDTLYSDLQAAVDGVEKTNVNDSFQIQHAADLYERLYPFLDPLWPDTAAEQPMDEAVEAHRIEVARKVLDLLSVRYIATDRHLPIPRLEEVAVDRDGTREAYLWVNPTSLPRAYVVPRARVVGAERSRGAVMAALLDADPREEVIMDHEPVAGTWRQPFTPAEWVAHDSRSMTVQVETTAPGLLVVGNTWMPGWTARVDGRAAPVLRGNHWQQVVPLQDSGHHRIILSYHPPGLVPGMAISATTLLFWAVVGVGCLVRTRTGSNLSRSDELARSNGLRASEGNYPLALAGGSPVC